MRTTPDTGRGRLVKLALERIWPVAPIFDAQVEPTRGYARDEIALRAARAGESATARDLLSRYTVRDSLLGGCVATTRIGGNEIALHHLRTVHLINERSNHVGLGSIHSMLEIGGGFGALSHLLLDNLPNLNKVVYLDVVPNLYVLDPHHRVSKGTIAVDPIHASPVEQHARDPH